MDWREHITVNPQVCHGIDENLPFKRKSRMPPLSCPLPKIKAAILLRTSTSLQPRTAVQHALYRKAFYIAIGTAVAVSLTACSKSPTLTRTVPLKTISITNYERVRLDLRTIKPSWYFYGAQFGSEDWKLSESSYPAKRVQYDADYKTMLWEEDYYYTGGTYSTANGVTGFENAVLHYDYSTGIYALHYLGKNSALQTLAEPFRSGTKDKAKVIKAADMILKSLGLSQL